MTNALVNNRPHKQWQSHKIISPIDMAILVCVSLFCDVYTTELLNGTFLKTHSFQ